MAHIAVVGAGIAGLAAARALRRDGPAGLEVTVLEGSPRIGGKLLTSEIAGLAVDEGAESFLWRAPEGVRLARDVGLGDDLVHPAERSAALWTPHGLISLPRTLFGIPVSGSEVRASLGRRAATRARLDLVLPGGPGDGDVAIGAVVRRRLGRDVADMLVDPLLGGVYAGRPDQLSLRATVPPLAGYRTGSLMHAAAALTGSAATHEPVFASVPGGLGRFAAAIAETSGADIVLGRPARVLQRRSEGGWRLVHGATVDEQALDVDAVVVAAPAAPAARLLTEAVPAAASELAGIDYANVVLVTLVFPRSAVPALDRTGYLVPSRFGRPVKAVTYFSAKWPSLDVADVVVMRCSFGRYGETVDVQRDDEDLVRLAVAEVTETAGVQGGPVASRVSRWGGALPQYAVGHLDRVARIRAAVAAVPGLAVCGAAYDGVGIVACIRSAERAAADILAGLPPP